MSLQHYLSSGGVAPGVSPFAGGARGSATKNSLEEAEQMVRDLDALALKAGGAARAEGVVLEK